MPNIANRGNPPKGMVFVYLKYGEAVIGASRERGYSNVWFKLRYGEVGRRIGLARFTGCGTEYGIQVDGGDSKFPMTIHEAD